MTLGSVLPWWADTHQLDVEHERLVHQISLRAEHKVLYNGIREAGEHEHSTSRAERAERVNLRDRLRGYSSSESMCLRELSPR